MELFEDNTHSFVVKISVKENVEDDGKQVWQGQITHVTSGTQCLFYQWEKMEVFLTSYLKEVKLPPKSWFGWNKRGSREQAHYTDD